MMSVDLVLLESACLFGGDKIYMRSYSFCYEVDCVLDIVV